MAWIVEYCLKCGVSRTDRPCPVCGEQTLALEDIQKAFSSPQPATDSKTTPKPRARRFGTCSSSPCSGQETEALNSHPAQSPVNPLPTVPAQQAGSSTVR